MKRQHICFVVILILAMGVVFLAYFVKWDEVGDFLWPGVNLFLLPLLIFLLTPTVVQSARWLKRSKCHRQARRAGDCGESWPHTEAPRGAEVQGWLDNALEPSDLEFTAISRGLLLEATLVPRIKERYELRGYAMNHDVRIAGQLPTDLLPVRLQGDRQPEVLYPALIVSKNNLVSGLEVQTADGEPLDIVSGDDALFWVAFTLRALLRSAFGVPTQDPLPQGVGDVEALALDVVACRRSDQSALQLVAVVQRLETLRNTAVNDAWLAKVTAFISKYAAYYVLLVRVQVDVKGRFFLHYRRVADAPRSKSDLGLFSHYLGAKRYTLAADIAKAAQCLSYHLEVVEPEGVYVLRQCLLHCEAYANNGGPGFHFRFEPLRGQGRAHFYAKDFPGTESIESQVHFEYREIPPDSTARATVVSAVSTALLYTIAVITSHKGIPLATDAASFILVFPAVAAVWLGQEVPSDRLLEKALAARVSLMFTTLCSLSGAALAIAHKELSDKERPGAYEWPDRIFATEPFWVTDFWWALLVLVSFANFIGTCYILIVRMRAYRRIARKST